MKSRFCGQRLNNGPRDPANHWPEGERELRWYFENHLEVRAAAREERAFLERQSRLFKARRTRHRFWGRDLDILGIERAPSGR